MISVISLIILHQKDSLIPPVGERFPLILRSILGCGSLILSYSSIKLIPLGDSQSIVFSSPVFISILGCLLLNEPCGVVQIIAVCATILGIFLISRPSFIFPHDGIPISPASDRTIGITMALCACIGASLCFICIRRLQKTSTSVVVFWYSFFCVIGGLTVSYINGTLALPAKPIEYGYLFICGLAGLIGQGLLTFALKIEHAGPVSLARATEIIMAFSYQVIIVGESVSIYSIIGATIIGCSVILVAFHKWYLNDQLRFKRIFCCQKQQSAESQFDPC